MKSNDKPKNEGAAHLDNWKPVPLETFTCAQCGAHPFRKTWIDDLPRWVCAEYPDCKPPYADRP